jgi:multidrug efflux pump subunit AcrA (membrane-fusion protein)
MGNKQVAWYRRHAQWLAVLLVLLIVVLSILGLWWFRPRAQVAEVAAPGWPIQVIPVDIAKHRPVVQLYGKIESEKQSQLSTPVRALIKEVLVQEGQQVAANALLVQLDDRLAKQAVIKQQALVEGLLAKLALEKQADVRDRELLAHEKKLLALADKERLRRKQLAEKKYLSDTLYDQAAELYATKALALTQRRYQVNTHAQRLLRLQAELAQAKAQLSVAEIELGYYQIRAPFAGHVSDLKAVKGMLAQQGSLLLSVLGTQGRQVRATVPTHYLPAVGELLQQQPVPMAEVVWQNLHWAVRPRAFSPEVRLGQVGESLLLSFVAAPSGAAVGKIVQVYLPLLPVSDSFLLPAHAVYHNDEIYRVVDGRLRATKIHKRGEVMRPGREVLWVVTSPEVSQADQVMVTSLPQAIDGMAVHVVEPLSS